MKNIYILILTIICLLGCKKNNEKKEMQFENNQSVILGISDDKRALQSFQIATETNLNSNKYKQVKKEIIDDSLHIVIDSIDKPFFADVVLSGKKPDYYFYRGKIFLVPGDTIRVKIKNGEVKFIGKHAVCNNFYAELDENTPDYNRNPYQGSLMDYKEKVRSIYDKRITFFKEYVEINKLESKFFINTITTNLKHEYLYNIINPANIKAQFKDGIYFNEADVLYSLFYKEQNKNPEVILDLNDYFGNVSLSEFKDLESFENSITFRMNLNLYIRNYFLGANFVPYSKEKFLAEKKFIETHFDGDLKNFAILRMLGDFHKKGFGKSTQTIALLKGVIDEYSIKFSKAWYIEKVNDIKKDLSSYNFKITKDALASKFVNINGDTLDLRTVFSRSTKRIKVLDFWATWCPPCIKQIKEGKAFKDRLSVAHNVEWIYISPEKEYKKWIATNKEYSSTLNFYNSFYLLIGRKASLSKFFKVNEIPRYIIFDQKNTIVLNNAPSPEDEKSFEKIILEIDRKVTKN